MEETEADKFSRAGIIGFEASRRVTLLFLFVFPSDLKSVLQS